MNCHKVFLRKFISISTITTLQIYQKKSCLYIRSDFQSSNSKVTGQRRSWNNNENCYRATLSRESRFSIRKIRKKEEEKQERERNGTNVTGEMIEFFVERQNDPRNWVTRHVDRISWRGVFHCGPQKRARKHRHFDLPLP